MNLIQFRVSGSFLLLILVVRIVESQLLSFYQFIALQIVQLLIKSTDLVLMIVQSTIHFSTRCMNYSYGHLKRKFCSRRPRIDKFLEETFFSFFLTFHFRCH